MVATVVVAVASAEVISTKIINRIEIRICNALTYGEGIFVFGNGAKNGW